MIPQLLKLSDAVKALGPGAPCEDVLRAEVRAGRLRAKRIGRALRVSDVELSRWALDTGLSPASPAHVTDDDDAKGAPERGGKL